MPSKPPGCGSRGGGLRYAVLDRNLHEQGRQRQIVENGAVLLAGLALRGQDPAERSSDA
jgi:hypothetical protein